MPLDTHVVILRVADEVRRADRARLNYGEPAPFRAPREAMLMAHGEWQNLVHAVKEDRKGGETAMVLLFMRLAAVMVKAAADLGCDKTYQHPREGALNVNGEATRPDGEPEDYGYIVAVRPAKRQRKSA